MEDVETCASCGLTAFQADSALTDRAGLNYCGDCHAADTERLASYARAFADGRLWYDTDGGIEGADESREQFAELFDGSTGPDGI